MQRSCSCGESSLLFLLFFLLFYLFSVVVGVVFMALGHNRYLPMGDNAKFFLLKGRALSTPHIS